MLRLDLQIPIDHLPKRRRKGGGTMGPRPRGGASLLSLLKDPITLAALILAVALLAAGIVIGNRLDAEHQQLDMRVRTAIQDSTRFEADLRRAEELRNKRSQIAARIERIETIDRNRFAFVHIMDQVAAAILPDIWIESIQTKSEDAANGRMSVSLIGYGPSDDAVASFMEQLEASPFIMNTTFVRSEKQVMNGQEIVRFELGLDSELPDKSFLELETIRSDGSIISSREPIIASQNPGASSPVNAAPSFVRPPSLPPPSREQGGAGSTGGNSTPHAPQP